MSALAPAPARADHVPCFDGLRAMAAMAVFFHHASIATAYSLRGPVVPLTNGQRFGSYFAHMDVGVQVFFLISGFLLYRPFVAASLAERVAIGTRMFLWRRALRVYPAYWFAFVAIAVFIGIKMPVPGARSMLEYGFLVHLYDPAKTLVTQFDPFTGRQVTSAVFRALGGISQSWTLVVEISFYVFLPVYASVLRRVTRGRPQLAKLRIELAGLGVLYLTSVAWRVVVYGVAPDGSAVRFLGAYWLPAQLDLFAMGMALAVAAAWSARHGTPRLLEVAGRLDWLWWSAAALTFHAATFWIGLSNRLVLVHGSRAFTRQLLYGLTALFLLVPAVLGPQDRGPVRRFLRFGPVAYLGTISYGIYLWHQGFIKKMQQWTDAPVLGGSFATVVAGAFVFTLVMGTVSWYVVERTALHWKDRPPRRLRALPAPSADRVAAR